MLLEAEDRAMLYEVARRAGADAEQLVQAIERESVEDVAAALGIGVEDASQRLRPLQRASAIGDDWGAGCRLLTDETRQAIREALRGLSAEPAPLRFIR